jgi:hypothetical protein
MYVFNTLQTGDLNLQITLRTGDFKPITLTCTQFTLKINIKYPNLFYEVKLLGNTKAPRSA